MLSRILGYTLGILMLFALSLPALAFAEGQTETQTQGAVTATSSDAPLLFSPDQQLAEDEVFLVGPRSTVGLVTSYAISGAALGALIGLGGYIISGFDWSPWNIAYFGAGGAVVGAAVGAAVAITTGADRPMANSVEWMKRDMPKTVQLRLFNVGF
jgi:hypothetical protein